jgi:hypothetical protein
VIVAWLFTHAIDKDYLIRFLGGTWREIDLRTSRVLLMLHGWLCIQVLSYLGGMQDVIGSASKI